MEMNQSNVQQNPDLLSPLTLAFIGDGVYELLVRQYIVEKGNCSVKKLHGQKVEFVRCETQAKVLAELIYPVLSEKEQDICLRGRNAHVGHIPKNASVADYHGATALEALFGWLYLKGEQERIQELFSLIVRDYRES